MSFRGRELVDRVLRGACLFATVLALVPLASVLYYVVGHGSRALSWSFLTALPKPVGEPGGGMAHALVGSLEIVALACLIGIPAGVLAGIHLAEFGSTRFGRFVRFSADILAGVPSIAVGLFVYGLVVTRMHRFSALAGAFALAILMLPTVTRSTEELLRLLPDSLREAALGLGVPKWRATLLIMLRTAAPGIATGVMLAIARAMGESAPLLFTALNNRSWASSPLEPTASLPVNIYTYGVSPYPDWHDQAWAAALLLVLLVLCLNLVARWLVRGRVR